MEYDRGRGRCHTLPNRHKTFNQYWFNVGRTASVKRTLIQRLESAGITSETELTLDIGSISSQHLDKNMKSNDVT